MAAEPARKPGRTGTWGYLIPGACTLAGLCAGLVTGYAAPGLFTGLGLGIFVSAFLSPARRVDRVEVVPSPARRLRRRVTIAVIGALLIIFGMGIIWPLFPYIIALVIILLGTWILVHGFLEPYLVSRVG